MKAIKKGMVTTTEKIEFDVDVIIIGGGPAGTAAGLTLLKRDDVSVVIVEKSDYSCPRIGESLTPGIRPLLEYLNVWESFSAQQNLQSFGSQAAWGSETLSSLDYLLTLHGNGWGLDRVRFDRMLAHAFSDRGGQLLLNSHIQHCEMLSNKGWLLQICDGDQNRYNMRCRYVIDASGRRGFLSRYLGVQRIEHDRLVGVACTAQLSGDVVLTAMAQVEACDYGWWYSSPVPGNKVSVVLMTDADIARQIEAANKRQWLNLLGAMKLTSERLGAAKFYEQPKVFPAFSAYLERAGGDGWVAVGDALASHDPLSSSGIPHAIGSGVNGGLVAADALFANGEMLAAYQQSIQNNFTQYQRTHWQYYQREMRWPDNVFWKRRTTAVGLDPMVRLKGVGAVDNFDLSERLHLPLYQSRSLYGQCQAGNPAHQVVREFSEAHPKVPDQHIILELQRLVERGLVKIDSGSGSYHR